MKAVISTTFDHKYLFYLPIVTWLWNKLGVDVICFMPRFQVIPDGVATINHYQVMQNLRQKHWFFDAPEHKQATYAQCARLYASAMGYDEKEILITSDIDMALFKVPPYEQDITIFGSDLVPYEQYPMCYASGTIKEWRSAMKIDGRTYQKCLDDLLGDIECEGFRGNYWGKDQETLWENTCDITTLIPRARQGTQFATNRVDRDDSFWRDRLNPDVIDAHLWRPGYTEENFANIIELIKYFYPNDDLQWMFEYRNEYVKLL